MTANKVQRSKPPVPQVRAVKTKRDRRNSYVKRNGLYLNPFRWELDQRTMLAKSLKMVREGLVSLFPNSSPDQAARLLIDRVTFKAMKLSIYEAMDLTSNITPRLDSPGGGREGHGNDGANFQRYIQLSNSLREDIRLLTQMANRPTTPTDDPDLKEYLEMLKKAAKAQVIKAERS